ncbi:MAG TPA: class I SAM-dependent methyltransferase [Thermoanaerobaculia bacterium]|jgi:SAM-dependent methyltransferase|nr:class I SAM-dependent methyltransferase [Thermoanaerobaculia bacterium]
MPALRILKALDPESAGSPEFRYLLSHLHLEARRAFPDHAVELFENPAELPPGEADTYLLLGPQNVMLCAGSLGAMRERLVGAAAQVRPVRLADAGIALPEPIYTLRGFERVEARYLSGSAGANTTPVPPSHLPATLLTARALRELLDQVPLDRLLRDPQALAAASPGSGAIETAGLCHEFIDYYGEVREDVVPFLPAGVQDVLEVGCGRGVTGAYLQRQLGCRVTGVELHPEVAADAATRLHAVLVGDLQTLDIPERFDAVLGCEIVEHLPEAAAFLARARELIRPGGQIVLSIPNVGHWSVVEDLLAGRWDYLPIGLLCYTHYRFFTQKTLDDWLRRAGWTRFTIHPQTTELPDRFDRLAETGAPLGFALDRLSLSTKGFYAVLEG